MVDYSDYRGRQGRMYTPVYEATVADGRTLCVTSTARIFTRRAATTCVCVTCTMKRRATSWEVAIPSKPGTVTVFDREAKCTVLEGSIEKTNIHLASQGNIKYINGHVKFDCAQFGSARSRQRTGDVHELSLSDRSARPASELRGSPQTTAFRAGISRNTPHSSGSSRRFCRDSDRLAAE